MQTRKILTIITTITLLVVPVMAFSAAQVTIDTLVEKQIINDSTKPQQVQFVETQDATPGDTLRFTLLFRNDGDAVANNVVLNNPVPKNAIYLDDSATSYGDTAPLFSIDGGETFLKPSLLTYETKNPDGSSNTIIAPPEKYTHIRWQLPPLAAGEAGQVSFNVLIQ